MRQFHEIYSFEQLLKEACKHIARKDVETYKALKSLESKRSKQEDFHKLFRKYYGLNAGGLSDKQLKRIEGFLEEPGTVRSSLDYRLKFSEIVTELHDIPNRKGQRSTQASFATKILAFKNDSFPIFDIYVSNCFGIFMPTIPRLEFRIMVFLNNLFSLKAQYETLATNPEIKTLLKEFRDKFDISCSDTRALDFMVYTAGRRRLY
jgi:hypothetical protein